MTTSRLDYWADAADPDAGVPSPRFVVLCAFRRMEIWEPGRFPNAPRVTLDLVELPDQYDALLFLAGREPVFLGGQVAVTRDAVRELTDLYGVLRERGAAPSYVLRDFLLQAVWCMFAEDLGQIPEHRFTQILDGLLGDRRRSSADDLGQLFRWLATGGERPRHGMYAGVPYVNGTLLEEPAQVHLDVDELDRLRRVAAFTWRQVQPQIFGSLLEGALGHEKQWELGGPLHARGGHPEGRAADHRGAVARADREHRHARRGHRRPARPHELRGARSGVRFGELPLCRVPRAAPAGATPARARA
ncbi:MAG: type IIL restriction-modification enzyme MmeI [Solirubrobacteraceae bacterium]